MPLLSPRPRTETGTERKPKAAPAHTTPNRPHPHTHRPEIDGLRAVAVLLVAVYHIWLGRVSGGVDVFLLLSGFLVTGSLLRAVESAAGRGHAGGIRYGAFLGRLAARLLPTAALVIAAVLLCTRLLLPEPRWPDVVGEAFASAFHHLNWTLALDSVDYLSRGDSTSPLQHFWSLSVQGQFYLLWPLLLAAAVWTATRLGRGPRSGILIALTWVFSISLAYSMYTTRADQPWAYFDTGARLWEFALGGLLALALPHLRLPTTLRVLLGWAGLAALVLCGVLLQVSTAFPGYAALWPTLAAAAVVVAGTTGSRLGADRLLTLRPVRYLGSVSYALYLWHWPVLVFYLAATERTLASPVGGAAVLALSVALAAATTPVANRLASLARETVGKPHALRSPALRGTAIGLACLLPVLLAAGTWSARLDAEQRRWDALLADGHSYPGAAALADAPVAVHDPAPEPTPPPTSPPPVYPNPAWASEDVPATYDDGCNQTIAATEVITCVYGSASSPGRTVALVGGSHAAHWFPALERLALEHDWRLVNIIKGACLFTDAPQTYKGEPYTACAEWNRGVMDELAALKPDLVFTTGTTTSLDASAGFGEEQVVDGYVDRWRELDAMGVDVIAVRDTPRFGFDVPDCLAERTADECSVEPGTSMATSSPLDGVPLPDNVSVLDLNDLFCEPSVCRPVVGNVLVYWDGSHVGATFMRTLAPELENRLTAATGW